MPAATAGGNDSLIAVAGASQLSRWKIIAVFFTILALVKRLFPTARTW